MFVFLLTPFDTWDCYYFESNLRLVLLIKEVLIQKHVTSFCYLLKWRNNFPSWVYCIKCQRCVLEVGVSKKGVWSYRPGAIEGELEIFCILWFCKGICYRLLFVKRSSFSQQILKISIPPSLLMRRYCAIG